MKQAAQAFVAVLALGLLAGSAQAQLLSHWAFNETSGNTAFDSVGGFNGTLSPNGAIFQPGQGVSGQPGDGAILFSAASGGFVTMGDIYNFDGTTSFSLISWVRLNNPVGSVQGMISAGRHSTGFFNGYFHAVNDVSDGLGASATTKAHYYMSGTFTPASAIVVNDGNWHQIVSVHNLGTGLEELYVDGVFQTSRPLVNPFTTVPAFFMVGGVFSGGNPVAAFSGTIDDVRVYGNALTAGEVATLFATVPEPATMILGGAGLVGATIAGWKVRKRRRIAKAKASK